MDAGKDIIITRFMAIDVSAIIGNLFNANNTIITTQTVTTYSGDTLPVIPMIPCQF